jgi:hypothetical protein
MGLRPIADLVVELNRFAVGAATEIGMDNERPL